MKQINYAAHKVQQGDYCSGAQLGRFHAGAAEHQNYAVVVTELVGPNYSGAQGGEEPSLAQRRYARSEPSMKRPLNRRIASAARRGAVRSKASLRAEELRLAEVTERL